MHGLPRRLFALVAAAGLVAPLLVSSQVHADVVTAGQDQARTAWDAAEPALGPTAVTASDFGSLFATPVQGQVYAQPLVVGGTVVTATEDNWVYGMNAVTGAVTWSRQLGPAWPAATVGCGDLVPNLGSSSTGVYDPAAGLVYLTTKVNDGADADHPTWYLHALNVTTGAEKAGWPVPIVGTPANDPSHPFAARDVNQRAGLLLMDGAVYMGFGSQCDFGHYVGWVAGVNVTTKAINLWSDEAGVSSEKAGIWQAGGGLVSDGPGRLFVVTGNGVTPPDGAGSPPPNQLSQSVVRLGVDGSGVITARDFFSPWNAATLDQNDQDLGSGGPAALPQQYFGTTAHPHLMVEMGKEGRLYLLDRDSLGGKAQGAGRTDAVLQNLGPYQGVWGSPAVYGGEGGYVYVVQSYNTMLAFKAGTDGQGRPALTQAGNTAETFGYTSGSPIVTSDGTTPGSAVVWVVNVDGPSGAGGRLCAYGAVPTGNRLPLLRCLPIGTASKFTRPASANGRVYVGTRDGHLYGFGRPTTAPLTAPSTDLGSADVGQTRTGTVTATATTTVTVTGVSATAPFAVTPPALPVTLTAGQTITVPVKFTPTAPGSVTGSLTFAVTTAAGSGTAGAGLIGNGVRTGFTASTPALAFGQTPVGATKSLTASVTNSGSAAETVTAVTGPAAPFQATGLPAAGLSVAPGQTVAFGVTYTPTAVGNNTSSIAITGAGGTATVALSGSGISGTRQLTIAPAALDFGTVPVGSSASRTLTVTNTGNLNETITKAAPPALPFVVNTPLPEGLVLAPGDVVQVPVTFAPTAAGASSNGYSITSDDGTGAHVIPVTGTGTSAGTTLPSLIGGGWVLNGSARMAGATLQLTTATAGQTGSALYSSPLPGDQLDVSFTAQLGGGTGADGMTFAFLDAAANTAHSLGGGGGGLGFINLPGVAVTLDTFRGGNDPSGNFVGVTTGGSGDLTYLATATGIPDLRTGTHAVHITAAGGTLTVAVDGTRVISTPVTLPSSVLVGLTGATGGAYDLHAASDIAITSAGTHLAAPGGGWQFNGSASVSGTDVVLTPARTQQAGSVLYSTPVKTDGLTATFDLSTGGGTGADGASFVLLAPSTPPTSVGTAGDGQGFGGLPAVAVSFVTFPQNKVGITTSTAGGPVTFVASSTAVPDLRAAVRHCRVTVTGTTVTVSVDGTVVASATVPALTTTAVVGFTAATGGQTDVHTVRNATVVTG